MRTEIMYFKINRLKRRRIFLVETKIANRVSVITIIINLVLSLIKFAVGFFANSQALISDAVHSASDVVSTIAVIFGVNMSSKKADSSHPYGHERIECIFSIILAVILLVTGMSLGVSAIKTITNGSEIVIPGKLALIAAIISIAVKEWMYHYTKRAAKKINSSSMMADAWHHRSDAFSSIGSLIGVGGAIIGFPVCEPIASIVICLFIAKAAYDIFVDAVDRLIDSSCSEEEIEKIKKIIFEVEGVERIDKLMTRRFGSKIYVDLEIAQKGSLTLYESHEIAEKVHDRLEEKMKEIKHCMIHVNPINE